MSFFETTKGKIAIAALIVLALMFVWSRSEGLAPRMLSAKDRVFGIIPASAALPIRRTY